MDTYRALVLNLPDLKSKVLAPVDVYYPLYVQTVLARWYLIYLPLILIFLTTEVVYHVLYVRTVLARVLNLPSLTNFLIYD